jgi:hypothetical protein
MLFHAFEFGAMGSLVAGLAQAPLFRRLLGHQVVGMGGPVGAILVDRTASAGAMPQVAARLTGN